MYSYLPEPNYLYSRDLSSYEFVQNANDAADGLYLYDFASKDWFYTSSTYSYPYLYDFALNAVVYYYQGTANPRYFFDFGSGQSITK
ncbi:MAG: hypothetical protein INR65_07610 [Gluconacetobacter diazotrophicus]|nr:hypothetical protein [Gluconacetobacter diazotrophicus]